MPGNGSSNTVGSNGSGRGERDHSILVGENGSEQRGEENIARQTGDTERYTPEFREDQEGRTSPAIQIDDENGSEPDHEPTDESPHVVKITWDGDYIESESIEQMDDIVEDFRQNNITKFKALSTIILILDLNQSSSERAKDSAIKYYGKTLDEIQALSSSASRRGEIAQQGLQRGRGSPEPVHAIRNIDQDAEIDELISQISRESKKSRKQVSGDNSDNETDFDGPSNKKRRIYESEMPWFVREEEARRNGNKDCEESRRLLQLFTRDYKVVKQWVQTSQTAPLGFPTSEWDNIIQGQAVNLDAVLSSLHHISTPKEKVGCMGHTEISLGRTEPAKKVQTSGEWTSAWNATIKATKFAFPHREQELREYGEYIDGHFSAKVPSAHRRIILYDSAIRNEVGGGQNALLTDTHRFSRFYSAIVMPDGIESDHARLAPKRTAGKLTSKSEICNRFNSINGCRNSSNDCRFRHACKRCKRMGHGKESCDVKEASNT